MFKKIIYYFNSIYRRYWDLPKNWHSDYKWNDMTDFYKSGKIAEWEK